MYITDRQNYMGFTYKSHINLLYLFTVYVKSIPMYIRSKHISYPIEHKGKYEQKG